MFKTRYLAFLFIFFIIAPFISEAEESGSVSSKIRPIVVNAPIMRFNEKHLIPWIKGITHLSTFGIDFKKEKIKGIYQRVDEEKVDRFIEFTKKHNLKVIWTLAVGDKRLKGSKEYESELNYVKRLIKKGMNIVAFKYGGEFYLPKYYRGILSKKGVEQKIDDKIYISLLKRWLPPFLKEFPFGHYEHLLVGASHASSSSKRDEYRKRWNKTVLTFMKETYPKSLKNFGVDYHLYSGYKTVNGEFIGGGEENIIYLEHLDLKFLKDFPFYMKIVITESGYFVNPSKGFSKIELSKLLKFWNVLSSALGSNDLYGIHVLQSPGKQNPLALYTRDGMSDIGKTFSNWLTTVYNKK